MITSAYSKSSDSLWFNPILQKFYEMICEIIVSKTVRRISLFFFFLFFVCQSSFINDFMEKNNFSESQNHRKLNILRPIYFSKFPHPALKILSAQISWKGFFRKTFSSRTWSFFHNWKTTNLSVIFFTKNLFHTFILKVIIEF